MTRVVDWQRVRRALAALDALVRRFPHLTSTEARDRLREHLGGASAASETGGR
jgi:hypothetical protein